MFCASLWGLCERVTTACSLPLGEVLFDVQAEPFLSGLEQLIQHNERSSLCCAYSEPFPE